MLPSRSVLLDAQGAQNRWHLDRGIPRYVVEQLRGVVGAAPDAVHSVRLHDGAPLTGNLGWLLGTGRLDWTAARDPGSGGAPAIYHAMSPFELHRPVEAIWPAWARGGDTALVLTLFDLIPLIFADHYLREPAMRARYLARCELVRRADHVLAISHATAADAVERLGVPEDRVTVVDAGVSSFFSETFASAQPAWNVVRERLGVIRPGFMFYVGGIEFRKNIDRLVEAYARMAPDVRRRHQLVVTCSVLPRERELIERQARALGVGPDELVLTGHVSDLELAALYRVCRLSVFASFYEGSGLPILESMAAGVPVCASNTSTSPEILGDLEATFDPFDVADMSRVLTATVTDDALLDRLRERSARRVRGYTWERTTQRTLEGYERTLRKRRRRRAVQARRPRIALLTPWPPERSGIASYNRRLVQALAETADVDVVVQGRGAYEAPRAPGARLVPVERFASTTAFRGYERELYCMGNSHFHGYVLEALQERGGAVVAHDVRLTGFYGWYAGQERPQDPTGRLSERIDAMYAHRLGASSFVEAPPTPAQQADLGLFMTHDLQRYADRLIVHSAHAADILRLDAPTRGGGRPPVHVLPHAFPAKPPRQRRTPDSRGPLIASFGIVSVVKSPDLLIEAVALLAVDRPGTRLVFAGGADDAELARWRAFAAELGVGDKVELPGHVDGATWDALLLAADVAVQLRRISNGEASGAVVEAVSAGVPTVVTDEGWSRELPDEVVVKLAATATAADLAEQIAALVDAPDRAHELGRAAQAHAAETSFERVARRYLDVLEL